jgi:hypothetical protein
MLKTLAILLLLAAVPPKPAMDQVKAYAASQHATITITKSGGYLWVEMSDSDVFGIGKTLDEAAQDFMADLDIIQHEKSPKDILHGNKSGPACLPNEYCI